MKKIFLAMALCAAIISCDSPKTSTEEDREAVKGDTLNPREGEGEGDVGEGVYGN